MFYDALQLAKGPSLGTNFTLCCPYTLLAHFTELPWAADYGVSSRLIRVSVGLENAKVMHCYYMDDYVCSMSMHYWISILECEALYIIIE